MEIGEALGRFAIEMREIEVGLAAKIGAIGEKGEGGGVGRPGEGGFGAGVVERSSGGDALRLAQVGEGAEENDSTINPGEALAIGGNGDLADSDGAPLAGRRWAGAGGCGPWCGDLGASRQQRGCAENERQKGAAEAAMRERHRKNAIRRRPSRLAKLAGLAGSIAEAKLVAVGGNREYARLLPEKQDENPS